MINDNNIIIEVKPQNEWRMDSMDIKTFKFVMVFSIIMVLVIVLVAECSGGGGNSSSSSSSSKTVECKWCHQDYSKGTENAKSISRTNMCKKCYNNYKGTKDALGD